MKIPTKLVRYKGTGHEALINVDDFDPKLHEVPKDSAPTPTKRGPGRPPKDPYRDRTPPKRR